MSDESEHKLCQTNGRQRSDCYFENILGFKIILRACL